MTYSENPARVLVIDDDPFMRQLLDIHLTAAGLSVELIAGGEEGLARARAQPPSAIVLDLAMPVVSGQDVLERLRDDPRTAGIPVMIVTAWSSTEQRDRVEALGAVWLEKPVDGAVLITTVEQLIQSRDGAVASRP